MTLRHVASLSSGDCVTNVGDVNCHSLIDAVDALLILRHAAWLTAGPAPRCPAFWFGATPEEVGTLSDGSRS